jgi:chromosome segregation protein
MYLKRIEILGFKTFATRTVLEFRPGITAIVGPNGSGKSNVADAMRWVLGEQSYATLRSKRAEDLIFGGGSRRAPSGFAEVALTIDNSDRLLPLPYSEVTIGRRATRSGEFEYTLNRNRVRLRDIHEAIGPLGGSYTIVNQGLVDSALNLRPEERRRLFEDAAEIGIYEQRKIESERRLRETLANIQRCDDVLADLEPRLRSLKRQAALARTQRELQAELLVLLTHSYTAQRRAAQAALGVAAQAEQLATQHLAQARGQQAAAVSELQILRDGLRSIRERLQSLHAASSNLHDHAEAAQRDLAVGHERATAIERRAEDLQRQQRELALRTAELERDHADATARLQAAEALLAEHRAATQAQEQILATRESERRSARQALELAQRAELQASADLAEARRHIEQLAARRERLVRERNALAPNLQATEQTLSANRADLLAAEQAVVLAQDVLVAANLRSETSRSEIERLRAEATRADEVAALARRNLADAEARLESLARLQRSYTGTFSGVRAAMQWAESQQRTGFMLVSTIVRTPAELETAIEIALGSRIQNIVVEQWADAEAAIDALKRNGAGRATFLPLDTIRRPTQDDRRVQSARNNVLGVAADLVGYDDHYAIVVWHLLGRTLVVQDLATARAELRSVGGGWTIVTLAGEQVNAGGAVTGGAQIRESGTLRRERELRELPELVATQRLALETAQQARAALEARATAAEQARRETEQARRHAQQEIERCRDIGDRARRVVAQTEADLALHQRRDGQVVSELGELAEQERGVVAKLAALEQCEHGTQQHLASLRAKEQQRSATEHADSAHLTTLRAALAAAEGEARAERTLLQSHAQGLARIATQRNDCELRVSTLADERMAISTRTAELEASHSAMLAAIDDLRRQIDPTEMELATHEATQIEQERQTALRTEALLEQESAYGRASVGAQRARDRLNALWERAAADDIDLDSLPDLPAEAPDRDADIQTSIQQLKSRIQRMGAINPLAMEEYEETSTRYEFLSTQLNDLRAAQRSLSELIATLDAAMQTRFEATFNAVAIEFERSFERLFGGGQARLFLTHHDGEQADGTPNTTPLGVEIVARPPGKRQQTLALLSGGERALTAAALLFAILKVNPTPFCVLDEVDAALDEANVGRFRDALIELAQQTQFLVITHNRGTIEAADTIYGVSMGDDSASRVLSLRLEELISE